LGENEWKRIVFIVGAIFFLGDDRNAATRAQLQLVGVKLSRMTVVAPISHVEAKSLFLYYLVLSAPLRKTLRFSQPLFTNSTILHNPGKGSSPPSQRS
jgi:hypothetical protein